MIAMTEPQKPSAHLPKTPAEVQDKLKTDFAAVDEVVDKINGMLERNGGYASETFKFVARWPEPVPEKNAQVAFEVAWRFQDANWRVEFREIDKDTVKLWILHPRLTSPVKIIPPGASA
jgi:hypothetical protein